MKKSALALAIVITTLVAGLAPANAQWWERYRPYRPTVSSVPQRIGECGRDAGVLSNPVDLRSFDEAEWGYLASGEMDFRVSTRGQGVWWNEATGFAFDGWMTGAYDGHFYRAWHGTIIELALQYELPSANCDRVFNWEYDVQLELPTGVWTYGAPSNDFRLDLGYVADPTGDLAIRDLADFTSDELNYERSDTVDQVSSYSRRFYNSGSMTVPAGETANLFVVATVGMHSFGGPVCLGLGRCTSFTGLASLEADRQDGYFDVLTVGLASNRPVGVDYTTTPA